MQPCALRDDIRLLGRLLGDTVRDQEGSAAFDLVERVRQSSIAFRRDDDVAARRELERMRFGSALNLNIHFHMLFLDGAYLFKGAHPAGGQSWLARAAGSRVRLDTWPIMRIALARAGGLNLLSATRWVSEGEFAEHADALLRSRFPGQDLLLFQSGDGESGLSFVFFDLSRRQSVLIAAPPVAPGDGISHLMRTLVRVPDTLILRGQALGMLTRPVSSAARLAWLATQTAATIAPPVHVTTGTPPPPAPRPAMNPEKWERELDGMNLPRRYLGTIAPLIDGEAFFTSFVQALQDARESVSIRLYIFDNDDYAVGIADLLKRRSEDVRVRVLIDGLGTLGAGQGAPEGAASRPPFSISRYLRTDSHVQVREAPNTWLVSDHTKTLIIDDRLAYVGGMNIGHEYRHQWHDMMVGLTGPIVRRLQRDFDVAWAYAGLGGDLAYLHALGDEERAAAAPPDANYVEIRPLYTRTLDTQVLRAQVAAMRRAGKEIWIEQPYVSDDALVNELIAALYDGWACVGSANFDKLSVRVNRETNVATSDPVFVGRLRQELFETDFARSRELVEAPSTGWGTYISAYVSGQL